MKTTLTMIAASAMTFSLLAAPATASADPLSRSGSASSSSTMGASSNASRSYSGKLGSLQVYSGTKFSTPTTTTADGKQASTSGSSWGGRWIRWNSRRPNRDGTPKEKNFTITRATTVTTAPSSPDGKSDGKTERRTFWVRGAAPGTFEHQREGSTIKTEISTAVTPAGNVVSAVEHHDTQTGKTRSSISTTFDTKKRSETRTRTVEGKTTSIGISSR